MAVRSATRRLVLAMLGLAALAGIGATQVQAQTITVTDLAGRTVEVRENVQRIILGEGRLLYALALLERDAPVKRVTAWADDMIKNDPDAYRKYKAAFPEIEKLAVLGNVFSTDFSVETAVAIDTDLVIFPTTNFTKAKEAGTIDKLEKIGVPVVFVDFRDDPVKNVRPSLELMGKILGQEQRAKDYLAFYDAQLQLVSSRLAGITPDKRPLVFIENAAGYAADCCTTYGPFNYGAFVELAGGHNWGSDKFKGYQGKVNPEAIFTTDFDVIVGTAANWSESVPTSTAVPLGYEATTEKVQPKLAALAARPGWKDMRAVKDKRFFSIYHQFYTSPYNAVAVVALAKLIHPELFADVDPEAILTELHKQFLPIPYSGMFWAKLS